MLLFLGFVALVVVLIGLVIMYYNKLVGLKNRAEQAWHDIDVQLRRRYDLIPNLVETVKGYAAHEKETLENVIKARQTAINITDDMAKKIQAENALTQTLRSLFAVAEQYPNLKANENFLDLQHQLAEVEDQLQLARRYYNAVARDLNITVERFPSNIIAGIFHFVKKDYFEVEGEAREAPQVKF